MKRINTLALVFMISTALCFGQTWRGKGRLEGTIKDSDGKPIANATIKLTNVRYGGSFEIHSDKDGKWVAGGISGGNWNIDIGAPGFALKQLSDYVSETARNKTIDIILDRDQNGTGAGGVTAGQLAEAQKILATGNDLFNQGKFPEALAEYQAILAKNPDLTVVNINIANCYYEMKQLDKAIESLNAVLAKEPTSVDVITRLGNIYAEMGNLDKAMEYFNKIDQTTIRNPTTFYNIGVLLYNNQKVPQAIDYFNKTIGIDPNFADGYFQLGLCYVNQNELPKAKEAFNKFLAIAPPDDPNVPNVQAILKSL